MLPPLIVSDDLRHFPGGPYPDPVVRAVQRAIRRDAGWHIAPEVRQTVSVTGTGSFRLILPTLRVATIHSVTRADTAAAIAGWRLVDDGYVVRLVGPYWAAGVDVLVEMTHGFPYDEAEDLLELVASRCQRSLTSAALAQRSETVGTKTTSESYNVARFESGGGGAALDRYRLPQVA